MLLLTGPICIGWAGKNLSSPDTEAPVGYISSDLRDAPFGERSRDESAHAGREWQTPLRGNRRPQPPQSLFFPFASRTNEHSLIIHAPQRSRRHSTRFSGVLIKGQILVWGGGTTVSFCSYSGSIVPRPVSPRVPSNETEKPCRLAGRAFQSIPAAGLFNSRLNPRCRLRLFGMGWRMPFPASLECKGPP